jgi:hypothetical protein
MILISEFKEVVSSINSHKVVVYISRSYYSKNFSEDKTGFCKYHPDRPYELITDHVRNRRRGN